MTLNVKKSQVTRIGPSFTTVCIMISVNSALISYVENLKYLACVLMSATSFKVSIHKMRVEFYKSFNSLYSKYFKFSEPVLLRLINAYCKPFLLYGMEAVNISIRELNTLNRLHIALHIAMQSVRFSR